MTTNTVVSNAIQFVSSNASFKPGQIVHVKGKKDKYQVVEYRPVMGRWCLKCLGYFGGVGFAKEDEIIPNQRCANGSISYSQFKPQSKYDVLDDLEASFDASDLKVIKPYAQKFGVLAEFQQKARELGVSV